VSGVLAHPALALFVGAALVAVLKGRLRSTVALAAPLAALALVLRAGDGVHAVWTFAGAELVPFAADPLSRLFGIIFAIMAFGGALFGLDQPRRVEMPAALLYAGAALGVAFAGDLVTVFLFWELMAVGSTLVIWSVATAEAYRASLRYLMVHLAGGTVLLLGVAVHYVASGTLAFRAFDAGSPGYWLILAGFLVNAGAPPLSAWVADAYPEASFSGTVFLSAFTTKIAVYALLRGFAGEPLLVWMGLYMVFYGIVYALLENDMRRILAYSIVNQVGFMVTGIGIGTAMALNGTAAHAFTHILYKGLLLMSAGAVLHATGRRKCSELGGLFRSMPVTTLCGIVGALAISSFPLTSGFVSKSMISQAAGDEHLVWVWLALAAASAGVFLHAGIKFPWFVFFQKDSGLRPPDPPLNMRLAMILFAALCLALGVWYEPLYALLPFPADYVPYTGWHVVGQLQLLLFSGLAFFALLPLLKRTPTITLDVDWLYRRALPAIVAAAERSRRVVARGWHAGWSSAVEGVAAHVHRTHGPEGIMARTWSVRSMGLWMLALLLGLLLIGFAA
jgi:multicomponent Na+:H+ antiporter subunit D